MTASFWRIWARRYSRLLGRGKRYDESSVDEEEESRSSSSDEYEEEEDTEPEAQDTQSSADIDMITKKG